MPVKPLIVIYVSEFIPHSDTCKFLVDFKNSEMYKEYFALIIPCEERKGEVKVFFENDFEQKKIEEIQNEVISLMNKNNLQ